MRESQRQGHTERQRQREGGEKVREEEGERERKGKLGVARAFELHAGHRLGTVFSRMEDQ